MEKLIKRNKFKEKFFSEFPTWSFSRQKEEIEGYKRLNELSIFSDSDFDLMESIAENTLIDELYEKPELLEIMEDLAEFVDQENSETNIDIHSQRNEYLDEIVVKLIKDANVFALLKTAENNEIYNLIKTFINDTRNEEQYEYILIKFIDLVDCFINANAIKNAFTEENEAKTGRFIKIVLDSLTTFVKIDDEDFEEPNSIPDSLRSNFLSYEKVDSRKNFSEFDKLEFLQLDRIVLLIFYMLSVATDRIRLDIYGTVNDLKKELNVGSKKEDDSEVE